MRSKTDPKTLKTVAILTANERANLCKTIDTLNNMTVIEGGEGYKHVAEDLRAIVTNHNEKEQSNG